MTRSMNDHETVQALSAIVPEGWQNKYDDDGYFLYYGWRWERIPEDVTRVRVDLSVRAMKRRAAFHECRKLDIMILNDRLEEIGMGAFEGCLTLGRIIILNAIKRIEDNAFNDCVGFTTMTLGVGFQAIGMEAH